MCAIYGEFHFEDPKTTIHPKLDLSKARGKDGFGVRYFGPNFKPIVAHRMAKYREQKRPKGALAAIANFRAEPTTERVDSPIVADRQPYIAGPVSIVHNGTIANDKELNLKYNLKPPTTIDSWTIAGVLKARGGVKSLESWTRTFKLLEGSKAIIGVDSKHRLAFFARDYQPLYVYRDTVNSGFVLSSFPNLDYSFAELRRVPFPPYTAGLITEDCKLQMSAIDPLDHRRKAVVICSGGLDSTVAAASAISHLQHRNLELLYLKYGCRAEAREWQAVEKIADYYGIRAVALDMSWLKAMGGSTLTSDRGPIAPGVAGAESAIEWVPARNMAMIGMVASYCDTNNVGQIYMGLNLEESGAYCDNSTPFYDAMQDALLVGTKSRPQLINPCGLLTKPEIVRMAWALGAPIHLSWSCYNGFEKHCGNCGPCFMRREAHRIAGMADWVEYLA